MYGAPRKIQRNDGTKVTHVVINAPRVAGQWRERPGFAPATHEADKLQHHDERSGVVFGQTEAIHHLSGRQ